MSHARHAKPRRVNLRGRHGTALLGIFAVLASVLIANQPTTSIAATTSPNITSRLRNPVDYGSGLWAGTTSPVKRIGNPATADRLIVGDSIVDRCSTDLVAAFAAKGETLAVISQPGQDAAGLYALLDATLLTPTDVIFAGGTNNVFAPFSARQPIADVKAWATLHLADVKLVDTYVARSATALHDLRNSGQVNGYLYASGLPVVSMVEQLTAAVGRGRPTNYYVSSDGVHYWLDAGTGHGDGCAFYAAGIVAGVGL